MFNRFGVGIVSLQALLLLLLVLVIVCQLLLSVLVLLLWALPLLWCGMVVVDVTNVGEVALMGLMYWLCC